VLAILFVDLSLALFALGGANPTIGFPLSTLSFSRSTTIVGPILDMVVIPHAVEGTMCEESGRHVSIYNALYCILQGSATSPPQL
jgi:hypothetical protein